jgi:hypothetical protein
MSIEAAARQAREALRACANGIEHLSAIARLWEPDHSTGADRRGWLLANDAKDDALAAIAALDAALPKPLDDQRLQGLFSDAISGALAFGAQNTNPPPAGHWLERFWQMGRAEQTK